MVDFDKIIRPNILSLEPYRCARDDYKEGILLDANENTHGPALTTISEYEQALDLNRYPDPHQHALKKYIVNFRNQTPSKYLNDSKDKLVIDNLCLGVGSDESIDMLLRCVCTSGKDKLLVCPPTYGMYSICATINDVELVKVPLTYPEFQVDQQTVIQKVRSDTSIKLIYLTSPGNPTAKLLDVGRMIELLQELDNENVLVVVDEAYIDFTKTDDGFSYSMSTLVNQFKNLIVMQTLSKSFGLAGIRLGITFSHPYLSKFLNSMKYPYNISSLTASLGERAFKSGIPTMQKYVDIIQTERAKLLNSLSRIEGIGKNIGGLDANFVLIEILDKHQNPSNELAESVYKKLAIEDQVVVRFRGKELNCAGALRISIGTSQENQIVIDKLKLALEQLR